MTSRRFDSAPRAIARLQRRLDDLWKLASRKGHVHQVTARARDRTGGTIPATEGIRVTATLSIPSNWTTYDIEAWMSGRYFESGTLTSDRQVNSWIRHTDAAGAILGQTVDLIGTVNPGRAFSFALVGFLEGETTTGSVDIVYTNEIASEGSEVTWDDIELVVHAINTS